MINAEELKEKTRFVGELMRLAEANHANFYRITITGGDEVVPSVDLKMDGLTPDDITILTAEDAPKEE